MGDRQGLLLPTPNVDMSGHPCLCIAGLGESSQHTSESGCVRLGLVLVTQLIASRMGYHVSAVGHRRRGWMRPAVNREITRCWVTGNDSIAHVASLPAFHRAASGLIRAQPRSQRSAMPMTDRSQ